MGDCGLCVPDMPILTIYVPLSGYGQYYNLDDRSGHAEIRSDARLTKYQFEGHGLRRNWETTLQKLAVSYPRRPLDY